MMTNNETVDQLNGLIEVCKDGEHEFRFCAEHAKADALRANFRQRASECADSARELQDLVVACGGRPDSGGSAGGAMRRGWASVKSRLTGHSDQAMLDECERGEDAALDRYREAAKQGLPPQIKSVVERQYQGVKRNHDLIRDLRNRMSQSG